MFLVAALLFITACGGGGASTTDSTATTPATTKVTLSGSVSETLAKPSLKPNSSDACTLYSAMSGGDVKVVDSKGVVVGAAAIAADGSYSVSVDKGNDYVVSATKGNVCLKSFVEKADTDKTVTVDPTSSAVVKVLGKKLGNDNLGDVGQDVSSIVANTDVSAIVTAINNSGLLTTIAQAIQSDIATNANYSSTTVTVGVVSAAGNNEANTVSLSITITITIVVNGQTAPAPSAPTGVTLTVGNGQLTIGWNAVTGATSYNLYYSTVQGVAGIKINGITTGTSYTLTGLNNGTTYYFQITASNAGAEGLASSVVSGIPQIPAPGAPMDVTTSAGNAQSTISWTTVTGSTSYNIYFRTTAGVTTGNGTKITGANSPYTHTGLTNNTTYYYVVTAVNAGEESVVSSEVNATPQLPTPTGIRVSAGNGQVAISWSAVSGATSYNVYRSIVSGAQGSLLGTTTSMTYIDNTAVNGTPYYFKVIAVNATGEGAAPSEVLTTPSIPIVRKVPDTGQTNCYNSSGSSVACAGTGQDGAYTINPPSYTDNGNGTITDNVMSIIWQKQDDGMLRDWDTAINYCSTLSLGGFTDWRLPSAIDLLSIVDYGRDNPSINTTYFPIQSKVNAVPTQTAYAYWSSTTNPQWPSQASWVLFDHGNSGNNGSWSGFDQYSTVANAYKTGTNLVRCVRLGQQDTQSFNDNGNGTITDNVTGMMWQKEDDGVGKAWANAINYCPSLSLGGFSDWRLPNVKELSSIVDSTVYNPAINVTYFTGTQSHLYWSSTSSAKYGNLPWPVDFGAGITPSVDNAVNLNYVRCVRLGP